MRHVNNAESISAMLDNYIFDNDNIHSMIVWLSPTAPIANGGGRQLLLANTEPDKVKLSINTILLTFFILFPLMISLVDFYPLQIVSKKNTTDHMSIVLMRSDYNGH